MTETAKPAPDEVVAALQRSGFPFQTRVEHAIRASAKTGWHVHTSEYSWEGRNEDTHFLDLIAANGRLFLTIECKKTRKDTYIFLRPLGGATTGPVETFRCLQAEEGHAYGYAVEIYCDDVDLYPASFSSAFCVVSTSDKGKDQRLLERDAGLLIRATDEFAEDRRRNIRLPDARTFIPAIITNAALYTVRYTPTEVSLHTSQHHCRRT